MSEEAINDEVQSTKYKVQSDVGEVQSTNDEVQSTKDEVISAEATENAEAEVADSEATEVAEEFAMEWPEGYEASEEFAQITTEAAKAAGIADGKLAGAYTAKVIAAIQEAADKRVAQDDAELKADWGADYQTNMTECKSFVERMGAKAGLTDEDVAVLATPKGMRLIQAIRAEVGEGVAAQGKRASAADQSWAREVMSNPSHPDYKAFHNPSDPRWREVNKRFNAIKGF